MRQSVANYVNKLMAKTIADADRLKAMPKADRPAKAPINDVRLAYADAMEELTETYTSRSQLTDFELPSDRLQATEETDQQQEETQ